MCGIVGYAGNKPAVEVLLDGLSKLEYRGYDSAGVAILQDHMIRVEKKQGRLENLVNALKEEGDFTGTVGIGHTRWATHGEPSDINSHPHGNKRVTIVHNGIIENYKEIKEFLLSEGYTFSSETDTETVAKLLDYYRSEDPIKTIAKVISEIRGSYSLGILFRDFPDRIYGVRKESPLIVGLGEDENFIASDVPAILRYTRDYYLLEENEIAEIRPERVVVYDVHGNKVKKVRQRADWELDSAEKGGFEHFMLKEIHEQPASVNMTVMPRIQKQSLEKSNCSVSHSQTCEWRTNKEAEPSSRARSPWLQSNQRGTSNAQAAPAAVSAQGNWADTGKKNSDTEDKSCGMPDFSAEGLDPEKLKNYKNIYIVACGTAMHAGMVGKYIIESLARVPVIVDIASEFRYRDPLVTKDDLVILISQSGETADTRAALELSKDLGATTLAIVNVKGSSIARAADIVVYTHAGPEISVASTKAYMVQVSVMYLLAFELAYVKGAITKERCMELTGKLCNMPKVIEEAIGLKESCQFAASRLVNADSLLYIGRGLDYALSMEGSLKLKEISYIHSESYAAGELKHGTISLITDRMPVIAVATQKKLIEKTVSNIKEVKSRGAMVVLICARDADIEEEIADILIRLPECDELLTPMAAAVPLQLIAYYTAVHKGCDVDKPRNLAKSVTVE